MPFFRPSCQPRFDRRWLFLLAALLLVFSPAVLAVTGELDLTQSVVGFFALGIFVLAYALVMAEEKIHMRKSKPVLVAAGIIWSLIGWVYVQNGMSEASEHAFRVTLLEFTELMLFLLVAMTYINALEERRVFDALRSWMLRKGFNYRSLFWLTGGLAFILSPIADNLTTALLMCAVVTKVAEGDKRFINVACINIVVAANAGGAFSPFGDITTLMVWQAGIVPFQDFFILFVPALVNFLIPAVIMSFFIPNKKPESVQEDVWMKRGARRIVALFLLTITTAVLCHTLLHLPPVLGMMTGLGYLQFFGYYLRRSLPRSLERKRERYSRRGDNKKLEQLGSVVPFDVFNRVARAEWDTLLFFYGVVMCVGGLGFMGYLGLLSEALYLGWNPTAANIVLGIVSAVVDNIPVMFAVLTMEPDMSHGHWLLITLTAGVGGSLLSIGSAAGVAVMGQARGAYTFLGHLKWSPVILLGYAASILVHMWLNAESFALFG
ncbi:MULTISPECIES: sodium:proton antiporter NhaD [Halomonadaceae]|jgi:NhaD family Na+/H+ antiporter|uniref:Sodium:proton antiporter NhaD n=1 Tax=Vreelandella janggokensis TaxID=370767 RepID=A0ABT4IX64_9GAMM|nr:MULTISPECIES: sodium:proton antiporter NhaD [Halomonas]MCW4151416.1 sodium:proton antiporter NhaD [Halomonas sp. 18H]MCZ0928255.1 sodium:proton antiporter NhaD [Halomonas janggokensis]MDR5887078.1 sodium:proton antiporter NhaD [Halomonas janggokensis]QPL46507.1 sodium:proton antiporter NhaD [Halomonas sp. A40-4]